VVLAEDSDFEYTMIGGTIAKVHRHGQGAKGDSKSGHWAVSRSVTTIITALTGALGNMIDFRLSS